MYALKIVLYVLVLMGGGAQSFAMSKEEPLSNETSSQKNLLSKRLVGLNALVRYSYNNTPSSFKGLGVSTQWISNQLLSEVSFSFSESIVQVVSPVKHSRAQRMWDLDYAWENVSKRKQIKGGYWMPSVGVRYKENLKVLCDDKENYCFNVFSDHWDILSKEGEFKPLLSLKYGFRVPIRRLWLRAETQFLTDTDSEYIGATISFLYGGLKS